MLYMYIIRKFIEFYDAKSFLPISRKDTYTSYIKKNSK